MGGVEDGEGDGDGVEDGEEGMSAAADIRRPSIMRPSLVESEEKEGGREAGDMTEGK